MSRVCIQYERKESFWIYFDQGIEKEITYFFFFLSFLELYHINKNNFIGIIAKTIIKTTKSNQLALSVICIRKHPFSLNQDYFLVSLRIPSL